MEQDEITRRNVAIAEYMGDPSHWYGGWYKSEEMEFDGDWSCLMPVVEKIINESLLGFHFFPPFGREVFTCRFGTDRNYVGDTMIEATWMAVSQYVLDLKS